MLKRLLKKLFSKSFNNPFLIEFYATSIGNQNLVKLLKYHKVTKIFDVGANTGQYAESLFDIGYTGKIISFEPLMDAYKVLLQKKKKNKKWQIAERCAIGEQDKEISINISDNLVSSSILPMLDDQVKYEPGSRYIGKETVQMFKLDTIYPKYIENDDILFLKMDVQGYEKYVLMGSEKVLDLLIGVQLECSLVPLYQGEMLFIDTIRYLESKGFTLHEIIPGISDHKFSGRLLQVDCIFFKDKSANKEIKNGSLL
jgi:FkbM family methyltransferase